MQEPRHLMRYQGQNVAVMHVRIQLPDGTTKVVPMDELETLEQVRDLGESEPGQWLKITVQGRDIGPGMEANGVWPDDIPRLLRQALTMVEIQQQIDKQRGGRQPE